MQQEKTAEKPANSLKDMDFVAWRIGRQQETIHRKDVNRQLSERPRMRRIVRH